MPPAIVHLPPQFQGITMSDVATQVAQARRAENLTDITFDFSTLGFIRPAGVVFLNNIVSWLLIKNIRVIFAGVRKTNPACKYLDDAGFFEQTSGRKLWDDSRCRSTTLPLQIVKHHNAHAWLRTSLAPWVLSSCNLSAASVQQLRVCISELFNNIQEHTRYDIGSIYLQHFPREDRVIIVLADFGLGIPKNVRKVAPHLNDAEAIVQATQLGFTSKSIATNQGNGLDILLKTAVVRNGGWVTIYSRRGIVEFHRKGTNTVHKRFEGVGFCPGTTIEINLRTNTSLADDDDEEEDFEW